ncbi:hypothetical protein IFM89_002009 [Coptis chinensis]|uniref:PdxS/SNZ N-terminal domain-containing protein n=1 Tax=Coptis chinensis TaxID=261450 RepID=A0A835HKF7_9MAGN|nr:hypothetical protein IFM89_002009 [Coptis chinensis]
MKCLKCGAFYLPGGQILEFTGLLQMFRSDTVIDAGIALSFQHGATHIVARHAAENAEFVALCIPRQAMILASEISHCAQTPVGQGARSKRRRDFAISGNASHNFNTRVLFLDDEGDTHGSSHNVAKQIEENFTRSQSGDIPPLRNPVRKKRFGPKARIKGVLETKSKKSKRTGKGDKNTVQATSDEENSHFNTAEEVAPQSTQGISALENGVGSVNRFATTYTFSFQQLLQQIHLEEGPGDVLVFLSGQEEIESLERLVKERIRQLFEDNQNMITFPIYSALPSEKQMLAFKPAPSGFRKIDLLRLKSRVFSDTSVPSLPSKPSPELECLFGNNDGMIKDLTHRADIILESVFTPSAYVDQFIALPHSHLFTKFISPKSVKWQTTLAPTVTIPVMAKAQILESIGIDYIDKSEVLTLADEDNHINKHNFRVPFVCGWRNLGEALRRIREGAAMIRTKGEARTGNIVEAVRHVRSVMGVIRVLRNMDDDEFAGGGVATPADAALMMQLGCDGVSVGSGVFKSGDPAARTHAIVQAVTHYSDPDILAEVSCGLGEVMVGLNLNDQKIERNCNGDLCCFNVSAKEDPSAILVFCSKGRKLRITRSWNFLGLEKNGEVPAHSLWKKPRFGQDIIIGNLENGD